MNGDKNRIIPRDGADDLRKLHGIDRLRGSRCTAADGFDDDQIARGCDGQNAVGKHLYDPVLHIRPIVTAADADIRFSVADSGILSVDGMRIHEVHRGDSIRVTGASRTTDFIRFGKSDLFRLIHEKLS